MIKIIDINFLGTSSAIACFLIESDQELILIETRSWNLPYITFSIRLEIVIFYVIKKESNMSFLKTLSSIEKFILGEKKPKDHWKQYRKEK